MEIGTTEGRTKTFSEDVLRIELSGPDFDHFSVIDVPGIFQVATPPKTTNEDKAMVNRMVRGYMSNPRTVILPVVPSNVDLVTEDIIQRAKELDPQGQRTLGILTKPDLVDKGAEAAVAALIDGKEHELQLGWHLLRNPGHNDRVDSVLGRQRFEENFFLTEAPWNKLDKDKVGVSALRVRLAQVLAEHIDREFPKVRHEANFIEILLSLCRS